MIKPYGHIINILTPDFSKLGFKKLSESEDSVVFGDGIHSIEIGTSLRDPLEMTIAIVDSRGVSRALWTIQNTLDWENTQKRVEQARNFIEERHLNSKTIAQLREDNGVLEYLHQELSSAIAFLVKHFDDAFNPSEALSNKYQESGRSLLNKLGLTV